MGQGNTQHTEFCPVYSLEKVTFTFLSFQGLGNKASFEKEVEFPCGSLVIPSEL